MTVTGAGPSWVERTSDPADVVAESDEVRQQPNWADDPRVGQVREELAALPGLVSRREVAALLTVLADVARGDLQVIQAGDCAEDPAECGPWHVTRKTTLLDVLAAALKLNSDKPVVRVGRIAGQFSKPRSQDVERLDGRELPVFRGHLVNHPDPDPAERRPDPERMLDGYWAAHRALAAIRERSGDSPFTGPAPVWTSHEALLLDYEVPLLRTNPDGSLLLSSTHWPWIGERTRHLDSAHVSLLARVSNPVACKLGPNVSPDEVRELCERLDPDRVPGRLTFISRSGADKIAERLPRLVDAVRRAGHPVIWLCDPLHGNTGTDDDGRKIRSVSTAVEEVRLFQEIVVAGGGTAGGLHLETTPWSVDECVDDPDGTPGPEAPLCDPRLNPGQALDVVTAWRDVALDHPEDQEQS